MFRRLFQRPSRPFFLEFELTTAIAFVLLVLLVLLLALRMVLLSQSADERIVEADLRLGREMAGRVARALSDHSLSQPTDGGGADPLLARWARDAGLTALEVLSVDGPPGRIGSGNASIDRSATPDLEALRSRGWALESERGAGGGSLWVSLAPSGYAQLAVRLDWPAGRYPVLRRQVLPLAVGAPVVLLVLGIVVFLQLGRVGRRIDRLVRGAMESGMAGDPAANVDETALVEGTIRRTVAELRRREAELEVLLARERDRAGELSTVSSSLRRNMPGGLLAIDPDGTVRDVNRRAREMFGLPEESAGRGFRDLLGAAPAVVGLVERALSGRETVVREEVETGGDGPPGALVLSLTAVPVVVGGGRFLGILIFVTDVTGVRQLERRLRMRETMASLGEMSAGLAHEMRNAIAAASGFCRLAVQDLEAGRADDAGRQVVRVRGELASIEKIVGQFLEFARGEAGEPGPVDLEPIARSVVDDLSTRHPSVRFELDVAPCRVLGDRVRIQQVLVNLLGNAALEHEAAGRTDGRVALTIAPAADGKARVTVEDDGRGVPAEIAATLFLPFVSARDGGTGLGLSLVHRYVLALGGDLRFEPAPDGGARFVVELPEA